MTRICMMVLLSIKARGQPTRPWGPVFRTIKISIGHILHQQRYIIQVSCIAEDFVSLTISDQFMTNQTQDPFLGFDGGFNDVLMGNFLNDIINTNSDGHPLASYNAEALPNVLHFGFDEVTGFLSGASLQPTTVAQNKDLLSSHHVDTETPAVRRAARAGEQAFRESIWLWDPSTEDSSVSEQIHLALPRDQSVVGHP